MVTRVQVVLQEEERERFRREADLQGQSLSAWLREAGRARVAARADRGPLTAASLRAFFKSCDAREKGREPDWEQHLQVMEGSRRRGSSGT